jgi:hypothetical protein
MKKQLLTLLALLITGIISAQVGIGTTTPSQALDIETNEAGGTVIDINNTGTGDPKINLQLNGTTTFSIGVDNSDSDKLKIGTTAPETSTSLTIDASQNVGIGNTSPTAKLDVDGSAIFNESGAAVDFRVEGDTKTHLLFVDASTDRVGINTSSPGVTLRVQGGISASGNDAIDFQGLHLQWNRNGLGRSYILNQLGLGSGGIVFGKSTTGDVITEQMFLSDGGYLGIGTSSPGYILTVNGQPGANGYTAFTSYSDRRLKTNIDSLGNGALDKILQLNPVSFQYNDKYLQLYPGSNLDKVHKGFIAQEIQKVFPEMVSEMKESPDSVQYLDLDISHLQVYLVKALQEQQAIIESQKNEINQLKQNILNSTEEIKNLKTEALNSNEETSKKLEELEAKINAFIMLSNPTITSKK